MVSLVPLNIKVLSGMDERKNVDIVQDIHFNIRTICIALELKNNRFSRFQCIQTGPRVYLQFALSCAAIFKCEAEHTICLSLVS